MPNAGYQGSQVDMLGHDFDIFYNVFNDTGGALTNGDVMVLEFLNDHTAAGTKYPTLSTPATTAITVKVVVVNNAVIGKSTIADDAWGYAQFRGDCPAVTKTTTANPVAIDDYLKAMNSVKTAATDGTSGSTAFAATTFAVAKSVVATGVAGTVKAVLLGREVTI